MMEAAAPQKISSHIFFVADIVAILAASPATAAKAADGLKLKMPNVIKQAKMILVQLNYRVLFDGASKLSGVKWFSMTSKESFLFMILNS